MPITRTARLRPLDCRRRSHHQRFAPERRHLLRARHEKERAEAIHVITRCLPSPLALQICAYDSRNVHHCTPVCPMDTDSSAGGLLGNDRGRMQLRRQRVGTKDSRQRFYQHATACSGGNAATHYMCLASVTPPVRTNKAGKTPYGRSSVRLVVGDPSDT